MVLVWFPLAILPHLIGISYVDGPRLTPTRFLHSSTYKSYTAHSYVDDQKNGFAKYIEKEKKLIGKKVDLEF